MEAKKCKELSEMSEWFDLLEKVVKETPEGLGRDFGVSVCVRGIATEILKQVD